MVNSISVSDLTIDNDLIDIRSLQRYNEGHIFNAKNIPLNYLISNYFKLLDKNKKYYIYCERGISSLKVCRFLVSKGYDVTNVIGGYKAWLSFEK